jgi:NAD(P)-dependent dehydrogenase (short-subunit alcohol dehydrogenase family)
MKSIRFFLVILALFAVTAVSAEQKVVLISGGSGGIGCATVKAFQDNGWKVWAGYNRHIPKNLQGAENVTLVHLDVTSDQQINDCIEQILAVDGRIDALVNAAGYGIIGAEETIALESAERLFDVNFFGSLRLIKAVTPTMRAQNSGHIINISSTSGVRAVPGLGLYAASKFALEGLSESLAVTLSPWNIKVSIVEPGSVKNQWLDNCLMKFIGPEEPVYVKLKHKLYGLLSLLASNGQDCSEIGELIATIAETENPSMRYQTSQKVTDVVAKKLVDPSGNIMRDEHQKLFDSMVK